MRTRQRSGHLDPSHRVSAERRSNRRCGACSRGRIGNTASCADQAGRSNHDHRHGARDGCEVGPRIRGGGGGGWSKVPGPSIRICSPFEGACRVNRNQACRRCRDRSRCCATGHPSQPYDKAGRSNGGDCLVGSTMAPISYHDVTMLPRMLSSALISSGVRQPSRSGSSSSS